MATTTVLTVDPTHPDPAAIAQAADAIAAGKLVAFPTETVYGLGANALDAAAVERIFAAKQRPHTDPLIVHLTGIDELDLVAPDAPATARELGAAFWPGPLTLVLPRGPRTAPNVSGGRPTVAVRVPSHPVAQALLRACRLPIAAPSANLFTRPSPTTARHVLDDLDGRVDIVLNGGPTTIGVESTVVDMTQTPPVLLRPGGAPVEALRAYIPDLVVAVGATVADTGEAAASPGLLLKHYSPHAPVYLLQGDPDAVRALVEQIVAQARPLGLRVAVLASAEEIAAYAALPVATASLGVQRDLDSAAYNLFAQLRDLDARRVDLILAHPVPTVGLGLAVWDRLFRAAEGKVIDAAAPINIERLLVSSGAGLSL